MHTSRFVRIVIGTAALALSSAAGLAVSAPPAADTPPLAAYFGFEKTRTIVVDKDCGPVVVADFNGDGRPDLAIVNNSKSRIELMLLRDKEKTAAEMDKDLKVNALRPSSWYDRKEVTLPQRVTALRAFDVDGDGRADLVYAGTGPAEIVVLHQEPDGTFKPMSRQRVRGLEARQSSLHIADVMGDSAPELITVAENRIMVFPFGKDGVLGEARRLGSGQPVAGMVIEDLNGDGLLDILGVVSDQQMPLRLWLQRQDPRAEASAGKSGLLGTELRFESPPLRDVEMVRFPGRPAASLGVIEAVSRRVVFYDLTSEAIDTSATSTEREVQAEAYGFTDGENKERSVAVADVDGDGMADLLATDPRTNTLVLYRQSKTIGLGNGESFSALKAPKAVSIAPAGQYDGGPTATVFVLSSEEKTVGVSTYNPQSRKLEVPQPLAIKTAGATPAAIGFVTLDDVGTLAVVVSAKRDQSLELHQPKARSENGTSAPEVTVVPLTGVSRPPLSVLACDADQDGLSDLLLFTPGEPMVMVRGQAAKDGKGGPGKPTLVLTNEQMPQFGLVQAAGTNNTALLDVDGDGKPELLIADKNFVRACRYDAKAGWRVVKQVTVTDPGTDLVGLSVLKQGEKTQIVAADKGNGRLLFIEGDQVVRRLRLTGFVPGAIFAGTFGGDNQPGVLCLGDDAFALTRLAGSRQKFESFAAYRSDSKDRVEHDLECGDINGDGYPDAVVMDGGEQKCTILTFSSSRKLLPATEFEVYQSRLFTGGDRREFEPRDTIIADVTGDGKADLVLLIHDRIIIYPQMTK